MWHYERERERDAIGENLLCVYCCWPYCTSDKAKPELPQNSCTSCSLSSTGRGTSSCLHRVQGKGRQEPTQELSMLQDTRELKEGLKAPAKAMQSSSYQPSPAQPRRGSTSKEGSHPTHSQRNPNDTKPFHI